MRKALCSSRWSLTGPLTSLRSTERRSRWMMASSTPGCTRPTGAATLLTADTVRINLVQMGLSAGSDVRLTASASTGIVAVDDGGLWGGVTQCVVAVSLRQSPKDQTPGRSKSKGTGDSPRRTRRTRRGFWLEPRMDTTFWKEHRGVRGERGEGFGWNHGWTRRTRMRD